MFNKKILQEQADILLKELPIEKIEELVKVHGSPILVLDLKKIEAQYKTLQQLLPNVKHYYALKSYSNPDIAKKILSLDGFIDVATTGEIELVKSLGAKGSQCLHSHPIKRPQDVQAGIDFGIEKFVFENEYELEKLLPFKNKIKLMMRLAFPNQEAQCDLSSKFGVLPENAFLLAKKAVEMGFELKGLSFHVGSQMKTPKKHLEAIKYCKTLITKLAEENICEIKFLDIGGGFPVTYTESHTSIEKFIAPIKKVLDKDFKNIEVLSEPGRFISGPSVTAIMSVIGRAKRNSQNYYYLDDGIYNSYSGMLFDHGQYLIYSLKALKNKNLKKFKSTLAGPTCDSIDVMYTDIDLPELELGDVLISPMMGAYAGAVHPTDFNLFMRPKVIIL